LLVAAPVSYAKGLFVKNTEVLRQKDTLERR